MPLLRPCRRASVRLAIAVAAALAASACGKSDPAPIAPATPPPAAAAAPTAAAATGRAKAANAGAARRAAPKAKLRLKAPIAGEAADWAAVKAIAAAAPAQPGGKAKPAAAGARRFPKTAYDRGSSPPTTPQTGFRLIYAPTEGAQQASFRRAFERERVFESVVAQLNEKIRINGVIVVELATCGEANAFYDDGGDASDALPRIILCYEIMEEFMDLFEEESEDPKELGAKVVGAVYHTFFHELGHALIDNLKLPTVGREEDAVDQLATLLLLSMGEHGIDAAFSAAEAFALEQEDEDESGESQPMWDEHSMSGQRMYDMLCMVYGSDTREFDDLVSDDGLPQDRAEQCEETFGAVLAAWTKLLTPHLVPGKTMLFRLPTAEAVSAAAQDKVPAAPAKPAAAGGGPSKAGGAARQDDD